MCARISIGAIVLLDQITKYLIQHYFLYAEKMEIIPGLFNLHYIRNTGAAWGVLSGWRIPLIVFSMAVLAVIWHQREHLFFNNRGGQAAMVLLCGGIVGNLLDRIRLGYVVDFLDFHHGGWHFPAFNVADSAICIGVGIYLLGQVRRS